MLGGGPERDRAAKGIADASRRTRHGLQEAREIGAKLRERAAGLSQRGFAMATQIVGVASITRECLLHARPAQAILGQAVDEHDGRALTRDRVAYVDIAEPDLHLPQPFALRACALASACAPSSTKQR